ncbi:MAG: hypothetical protein ACLRZH_04040 [Ruthenibacterium lactatiformans]
MRSRIVPYAALYAVLLALHLQFTLGTGDDPMYAAMLDQYCWRIFRCGITIPGRPGR